MELSQEEIERRRGLRENPFTKGKTFPKYSSSNKVKFFSEDSLAVKTNGLIMPTNDFHAMEINARYDRDVGKNTKVYQSKEAKFLINRMTNITQWKIMWYIIMHLGYNKQVIRLIPRVLAEYFEVTEQTVRSAIERLEGIGVLARKGPCKFWINPHILFNGNRLKRVDAKYKKATSETEMTDEELEEGQVKFNDEEE
jgi:hypothetical protein